ncbi:PREDICTED: A-kinase anchor protein inhibitor 1 [Nanorana parkeri]|uniref:A-kinase anchor protein inhibitor 1 n=1 Tax=Nanorana parkeri TaxID=125878 RepID=UPI000854B963|nr:PREDICTED: A-kinase anchor protein inhibitor 1 [Nanorana parkeri]
MTIYALGENLGKDPEEVKLQNASKQIVETVILQAVQQISQEELKENRQNRNAGEILAARRSNEGHGKK